MKNILGINLDKLLREAVRESVGEMVGSDNEKLKQAQASAAMKNFHAAKKSKKDPDSEKQADAVDEDENNSGLINKEKSKNKTPDVDLPALIDLIGSIRSGRSLKDKDVMKDFKIYFKRLNGNERLALFAFLTGISKIMLAPESEDVEKVKKPSSDPYSVKMDREIKKAKKEKNTDKKSDDTPIMIGESQDKSKVLRKLKLYRQ